MADSASAVLGTASLPPTDALERATAFTREPFVFDGEDPAVALAPGTPRRRALDAALAEIHAGADVPSVQWRRDWSLLLGLDRVLSQDEPHLVDGTVLSAHQVDALSGTLTALLAEVERVEGPFTAEPADEEASPLASAGIPGEAELPQELQEEESDEEPQDWSDEESEVSDEDQLGEQPEDPNAGKRFWFEHATGAGKTVAALGFVESSQTGGVLILTHRRNLVDQFHGELKDRGYAKRITAPLLRGQDSAAGPVTVETYQWFVRNAGNISDAYTIVICDEAHTALGEKTSAAIRAWGGPVFVGMTATGALIARHVTDLFPTQTSRFDLAQAARRGVISPLRCVRIPPGPGVRTIAKVPLRRGEVDVEFDQEMLAELLDQLPFNVAIADLYKTRFDGVPGVVYAAGVRHAHNVAEAFREIGLKARAVSGETPKRELAQILAAYERGDIDVLVNAQLLAEGWNSPRATICLHLAPTASKRIYQQRVGRVTRRHPGKEAGIVVDFVHPATKHDDPVVTLHSLLDREVYRGGAIVVGPVRRGRGRRLRVERRVVPVTADPNRRIEVFERELWRIAVEHLDWGEQVQWAALAGARVTLTGWRRARAMLHFDSGGELKRTFLVTAVQRNKNPQVRLKALQEIAAARDADAFDAAVEVIGSWPREERREGVKLALQALAEKKLGRRDQANNWIWRCAEYTLDVHEEYAVQRWPETKRLLGLLVNSAAGAHARNARRLVHAARDQDRRLQAALLAAAVPHTAEAGEVINGARARLARKPPSLARELLKNFPKPKSKKSRRRRRKGAGEAGEVAEDQVLATVTAGDEVGPQVSEVASEDGAVELPTAETDAEAGEDPAGEAGEGSAADRAAEASTPSRRSGRRRRGRRRGRRGEGAEEAVAVGDDAVRDSEKANGDGLGEPVAESALADGNEGASTTEPSGVERPAKPRRTRTRKAPAVATAESEGGNEDVAAPDEAAAAARTADVAVGVAEAAGNGPGDADVPAPTPSTADEAVTEGPAPAPTRRRTRRTAVTSMGANAEAKPATRRRRSKAVATEGADALATEGADAVAAEGTDVLATEDAPAAAPKRPRRSRKAARNEDAPGTDEPSVTTEAAPTSADGQATDVEAAPEAAAAPKRARRTRKTAAETPGSDEDAVEAATEDRTSGAPGEKPAAVTPAPARTTRRRASAVPVNEAAAGAEAPPVSKKPRRTRRAATTDATGDTASAPSEAAAPEPVSADAADGPAAGDAGVKPKSARRTRRPAVADPPEPAGDAAASRPTASDEAAKPPARQRRTTARKTTTAEAKAREAAAADVIAAAPRRARTTRSKTPAAADLADAVQRASDTVQDAVGRERADDDRAADAAA